MKKAIILLSIVLLPVMYSFSIQKPSPEKLPTREIPFRA